MRNLIVWLLGLFRRGKAAREAGANGPKEPADVTSGSGMKVVASAGASQEALPESDDRMEIVWRSDSQKTYECAHQSAARFKLHVYGLETDEINQAKRCPECLLAWAKQHVIRCALCGLPIRPGEGVAVYGGGGSIRKDIATVAESGFIGCLRWDCCPSGGFYAGHWTEQGFAPIFGGRSAVEEAASSGQVIVGDTDEGSS